MHTIKIQIGYLKNEIIIFLDISKNVFIISEICKYRSRPSWKIGSLNSKLPIMLFFSSIWSHIDKKTKTANSNFVLLFLSQKNIKTNVRIIL